MEAKNFVLEVLNGKNKGQTFELEADVITIGRRLAPKEKKRDWILLDENSLARIHALLQWDPDKTLYKAVIKSSSKSIIINGRTVKEGYLYHLDKLQLGDVSFRIWDGPVGSEPVDDYDEEELPSADPDYEDTNIKVPENRKISQEEPAYSNQESSNDSYPSESQHPKKNSALQKSGEASVKPFSFFSGKQKSQPVEQSIVNREKKPKILGGSPPEEKKEDAEFKPISLTASYSKVSKSSSKEDNSFEEASETVSKPSLISGLKKNSERSSLESVIAKRRQENSVSNDEIEDSARNRERENNNRRNSYDDDDNSHNYFSDSKKPSYIRKDDRISTRSTRPYEDDDIDEEYDYEERSRRRGRSVNDDYEEAPRRRTRPSYDDYEETPRRKVRPSSDGNLSSKNDDYEERSRRRTRPSYDDYEETPRHKVRPSNDKLSSKSFDDDYEERSNRSVEGTDSFDENEEQVPENSNIDVSSTKGTSGRFFKESRIMSALTGSGGDNGIFRARRESKESTRDFSESQIKNRSIDDDSEPFGTIVPDTIGAEAIVPLAAPVFPENNELPKFSGSIFDRPSAKDSVFSGYKNFINSSENFVPESGINQRRIAASIKQKLSAKVPDKIQLPSFNKNKVSSPLNDVSSTSDISSSESVADIVRQASVGASVGASNSENSMLADLPSGRLNKVSGPFDEGKFQPQFSSQDSSSLKTKQSGLFGIPFEQNSKNKPSVMANAPVLQSENDGNALKNPFIGEQQSFAPVFTSSISPASGSENFSIFENNGFGQDSNRQFSPAFEMPSSNVEHGSFQNTSNINDGSFFTKPLEHFDVSSGQPFSLFEEKKPFGRFAPNEVSDVKQSEPNTFASQFNRENSDAPSNTFSNTQGKDLPVNNKDLSSTSVNNVDDSVSTKNSNFANAERKLLVKKEGGMLSSKATLSSKKPLGRFSQDVSSSKPILSSFKTKKNQEKSENEDLIKKDKDFKESLDFPNTGVDENIKSENAPVLSDKPSLMGDLPKLPSVSEENIKSESAPVLSDKPSLMGDLPKLPSVSEENIKSENTPVLTDRSSSIDDLPKLPSVSEENIKSKNAPVLTDRSSLMSDLPKLSSVSEENIKLENAPVLTDRPSLMGNLPKLPSFSERNSKSEVPSVVPDRPSLMDNLPKLPSVSERNSKSEVPSVVPDRPSLMDNLPKLPSFGERNSKSEVPSVVPNSPSLMDNLSKLPSFGERNSKSEVPSVLTDRPLLMDNLPKLPSFGERNSKSEVPSVVTNSPSLMDNLPKLPSFGERNSKLEVPPIVSDRPSLMGNLPKLPSFGERNSKLEVPPIVSDRLSLMGNLPKLPSFGEINGKLETPSVVTDNPPLMDNLPKLPSFGEINSKLETSSVVTDNPPLMDNLPKLPSFGERNSNLETPSVVPDNPPLMNNLSQSSSFIDKGNNDLQTNMENEKSSVSVGLSKLPSFASSDGKAIGGGLSTLPKFGESSRIVEKKEEIEATPLSDVDNQSDKKKKTARGGKIRFSGDNVFKKTVMSSAGFTNAVDADMKTSDSDMEKFLEVIQQNREENEMASENSDSSGDFINSLNKSSKGDKKGQDKLFGPASSIDLPFSDYKIKIKKKETPSDIVKQPEIVKKSESVPSNPVKSESLDKEKVKNNINTSNPVTSISLPSLKKNEEEKPKDKKKKKEQYDPYGFLIQEEEPKKEAPKKEEIFSWADDNEEFQAPSSRRRGGASEEESSVHSVDAVSSFIGGGGYKNDDEGEWTIKFTKLPGNSKLKAVDLNSDLIIGRSPAVDMQIKDPALADRHVKIYLYEGKLYLQKLDRKKQIFINGNPLISSASRLLKDGDKIQLSELTAFELIKK